MKNQYSAALAAFVMFAVFMPCACDDAGKDFTKTKNEDGTWTITEYKGTAADVVIPEKIGGRDVTVIGENAFRGTSFITSVIMPNTIREIKRSAFYSCNTLSAVTFSNNLKEVSWDVFTDCDDLPMPNNDNIVARFSVAQSRYFPNLGRSVDLGIDDYLSILKEYIHPYRGDYFPRGVNKVIEDGFVSNNGNEILPSKIAVGLGSKPARKILVLETGFEKKSLIHSWVMHYLPLEYIPANVAEVEYILAFIHREGETKYYTNDGRAIETYLEAVLYKKNPRASTFIRIGIAGTLESDPAPPRTGWKEQIISIDFGTPEYHEEKEFRDTAIEFVLAEVRK
jgi:hypothetical protein